MLIWAGSRRRIVRHRKAVIPAVAFDSTRHLEGSADPARNDEEVEVLYVAVAGGRVGSSSASNLVCPERVQFGLERKRISLRCLTEPHEMARGDNFRLLVPGKGLVFAILRHRHELPNSPHLTLRFWPGIVRGRDAPTLLTATRACAGAKGCEP